MAQSCGFCYSPGQLLTLGGVHQHAGFCRDCCVVLAGPEATACPACGAVFTAVEKHTIASAVAQTSPGASPTYAPSAQYPAAAAQSPLFPGIPLASSQYQPASSQYQPASSQYQQAYQPAASSQYQPAYPQYQSASSQYQPASPQYQPASPQYTGFHHSNSSPGFYSGYGYQAQSPQQAAQPPQSVVRPPVQLSSTGPCFKCNGNTGDDIRLGCSHMACRTHLKEYLTAQSKQRKEIKCPHSNCSYICPAHTIMLIIDKEDFRDYRRIFLKNIMVVCPRPDCRVIEQIGEKHRIVECSNCRNAYCSRCEKTKAECRCEVPKELVCKNCYMIMRPDRHKLMVCGNCRDTMCTYCSQGSRECTCNHNALTAITRIDEVAACEVCGEYMRVSELQNVFAMEDCTHVYHKECIEGYVTAKLESGQFSDRLTCPKQGCMGIVGDFQKLVTPEQWALYERKLIESLYKLVQCPNTGCQEEYTVEGDMKSITCNRCKQSFCLSCKEPPHEGNCSRAGILAKIRMLEATGDRVSQCPGCKLPYIKDEHCEHVKCVNPDCRVEFCFTCSCLRVPTVKHCNAWHRPGCKWYESVGAETEKFRQDCPECVRLGRRCDPPKALRVSCRFDEDEE